MSHSPRTLRRHHDGLVPGAPACSLKNSRCSQIRSIPTGCMGRRGAMVASPGSESLPTWTAHPLSSTSRTLWWTDQATTTGRIIDTPPGSVLLVTRKER